MRCNKAGQLIHVDLAGLDYLREQETLPRSADSPNQEALACLLASYAPSRSL
jgi:hypothetical protein